MNDDRLRQAFAELRREEAAHVPPFRVDGRRGRWPATRLAFALLVLMIVAMIFRHHNTPQPSIAEWRAPTDFLLKTPGQELLTSVPHLKGTMQ
ncbi:MAG TPA: hypothetical protein VII12_00235 [Thermoanaerobaculia bacterium]